MASNESSCGVLKKSNSPATTNFCMDRSMCCDIQSDKLDLDEDLQKSHTEDEISVCGRSLPSVCDNVSDDSRKPRDEDQISVCEKDTCAPAVCQSTSTDSKESDNQEKISICRKRRSLVYDNISSESSSFSDEEKDLICGTEEPFTITCAPLSACYNMVEESDPLVEEMLKQLPRTRYTDESRGYWEMMLHCERAAFPRAASNLPLPSREARFYWHLYSTAVKNSHSYQKQMNRALLVTLAKLQHSQKRKKGISVWEQLIRLQSFDRIGRKNAITHLERLISKQTSLESICLEGLSLTPDEGVRLLLALYNSRKTMRYVYCWRAFEKMVGLTEDTDRRVESRFYTNKRIKKCDWFRAIGCFEFLTTLSVNYAYIATPTGDLLISLAKKLRTNWHWLQLLCLEEELVRKTEYGGSIEKAIIPGSAWKAAHFWAPVLKVQYAIIGIPQYDIHKKFLTRNTRVHTFALSTSIDLRFQQPWYLDCTLKTLCTWYSDTLVYLCLQLWHNRQNLDDQLRKLFLYLPSLRVFEFIGEIRTLKTLCGMCCQIRSGRCNVCRVNMQLQNVIHDDLDKETWVKSIRCLMVCFKYDFDRMGIKFDIDFYCC